MRVVATGLLGAFFMLAACAVQPERPIPRRPPPDAGGGPRTSEAAANFDLERPVRCKVDWTDQEIISTVPYERRVFQLERSVQSDPFPDYEVAGLSFTDETAGEIYRRLFKGTDIEVVTFGTSYPLLSAEDVKGSLETVVRKVAEASDLYVRFDASANQLVVRRKVEWRLLMPSSKAIILALLDALRGAGLSGITTDWKDEVLLFEGTRKTEKKVRELIAFFRDDPTLLAYDVDIYRIYPVRDEKGLPWQDLLDVFSTEAVQVSTQGVLGRLLVVDPLINRTSLRRFLKARAAVSQVSQGMFIVPDQWRSRFDVGRCSHRNMAEADLSILVKSAIRKDRVETELTLDTSKGEITNFSVESRLGENYLVIGVPTDVFSPQINLGEVVMLLSPRLIRIVETGRTDEE